MRARGQINIPDQLTRSATGTRIQFSFFYNLYNPTAISYSIVAYYVRCRYKLNLVRS